ncbi:CcdB family protein [Pluralibacter gergoviae]|uniref:Toxin CcdB n=1 Tax=Pluralibacter gergoviae TaxID=61647 RepID=A0A0J5L8P4_PLUGE|nr:CcdB family protein [Pluralibacter gergoviae]EKV0913354.1 CcdB family protein [Pluralibacter gergoviae]EKV9906250.1 CcdB family protein [Pluralibacter gergoviae]EKW7272589.1 CcdB family protein [Pluralibacter gergoviae]ELD4293787.1 CcdB family protein [Pluralibacter gergoviae]ELD4304566.1 CcdB family protein [Pluralibacter gergoviae]
MQYVIYRNKSNRAAYPYLLDIQSDIIDELDTRLVVPLYPTAKVSNVPVKRLTPSLTVEGEDYLVMTHEMAAIRLTQLGDEVMNARPYRQRIRDALDFIIDGF